MAMDEFTRLVRGFEEAQVRFVVIGVSGINYYVPIGTELFMTDDRDLFIPPDPANLLACWKVCDDLGLELTANREPLEMPLDLWLAERVVGARATVRGASRGGLAVDLTMVMGDFQFEVIWQERHIFKLDDVPIPVARLEHLIEAKKMANREKDVIFLHRHDGLLKGLLDRD